MLMLQSNSWFVILPMKKKLNEKELKGIWILKKKHVQNIDFKISLFTYRMNTVVERARLVRKVQQQHAQILELSTMLELQRLRTFPTLNIQPNLKKEFH